MYLSAELLLPELLMKKPLSYLKSIFIILIFISFQQILFSQNNFTIGVKGGIVSSQYITTGQIIKNSDHRAGLSLGISAQLFKTKNFMLMPEAIYLQRGMSFRANEYNNVPLAGGTSVSYLSFAFLPSARFDNKVLSPYFFAGPRLEFALSHNDGDLTSFYNLLNNTNAGFSAGIGLEKEIAKKISITGEFRFSRDFTSFRNSSLAVGGEFSNYTNSSFDFLLGVNFRLEGSIK